MCVNWTVTQMYQSFSSSIWVIKRFLVKQRLICSQWSHLLNELLTDTYEKIHNNQIPSRRHNRTSGCNRLWRIPTSLEFTHPLAYTTTGKGIASTNPHLGLPQFVMFVHKLLNVLLNLTFCLFIWKVKNLMSQFEVDFWKSSFDVSDLWI